MRSTTIGPRRGDLVVDGTLGHGSDSPPKVRRLMRPLTLLAVFGAAQLLAAQIPEIRIDGRPRCGGCKVQLQLLHRLVPPPTADPIGFAWPIARSARGISAIATAKRNAVLLFDQNGRFVRQFGTQGDGPGEFRTIIALAYSADTLLVLESRRYHVVSPELVVIRSNPLRGRARSVIPRPDGRLVVHMQVGTPAAAGYPLHVVTSTKGIVQTYGAAGQPTLSPGCASCELLLAPGVTSDESILIPANEYAWEIWADDGTFRSRYAVDSSWFKRWRTQGNWIAGLAPRQPSLQHVRRDSTGLLWAISVRAPSKWSPHPPEPSSGIRVSEHGIGGRSREAMEDYMWRHLTMANETVIEIIDPSQRRVLSSTSIPGSYQALAGGLMARLARDEDGVYGVQVYRLVRPSRGGRLK